MQQVLQVEQFGRLVGDNNPVHGGEDSVAHGTLLLGLLSGVIAEQLPGCLLTSIEVS